MRGPRVDKGGWVGQGSRRSATAVRTGRPSPVVMLQVVVVRTQVVVVVMRVVVQEEVGGLPRRGKRG